MFKTLFTKKDHFGGYLPEPPDMPTIRDEHPEYKAYSPESGYPQTDGRGGSELTDTEYRDMLLYEHRGNPEVWYSLRDKFATMNQDEFSRYRENSLQSAVEESAEPPETPQEEYDAILALREELKTEEGATDEELDELIPLPVLPTV